jgi:hypothetical protein
MEIRWFIQNNIIAFDRRCFCCCTHVVCAGSAVRVTRHFVVHITTWAHEQQVSVFKIITPIQLSITTAVRCSSTYRCRGDENDELSRPRRVGHTN